MPAKSSAALERRSSQSSRSARATSSAATGDAPWLAANPWLANLPWMSAAAEYAVDAWQRSVLFADVMRQRGNQYQEHLAESAPNVLDFDAEVILDAHALPRPCNYCLMRIVPPKDTPTLPNARPFVVVDPRAGHGPGIGGFKPDSEIGAALRAGHPCYFVGFLPDPVPGQTVEDVMRAEAAFLEKVISMHPESAGKPAVIGNCQAGWQILMTAAMRPDLFGPIIVAGAPVSYWAGWRGRNPMRYSGGLLGGSWLTALTSDLGDGRFDGAWLVQNFENLDPANTLWRKKYHLYANVDTEAQRYLGFEKYWGGHVFLNAQEMQYIVDNLFVGNRLTSAELITSDGIRLDLRNIRSPIVVFCSYGDNITPPPQALGFVTDMYRDDAEVLSHDQTIVYATHDSIGHLGIFVSGSTGRKEHRKFVNNIDLIDVLPAGIYQAQIADKTDDTLHGELAEGDYVMSIQRRSVEDVRAIVQPDTQSDRRFAAVAHLSDIHLGLYRSLVQPWVRAMVTPTSAYWMRLLHPLRVSYELWSDRNPFAAPFAEKAERVRETRHAVSSDNPFLALEMAVSTAIEESLNFYRDMRDDGYEKAFEMIYGQPWVQALAGLHGSDGTAVRVHPGTSPEHVAFVREALELRRHEVRQGGVLEAGIRALLWVHRLHGEADERQFNLARSLPRGDAEISIERFREIIRRQAGLLRMAPSAAMEAIPGMLAHASPASIRLVAKAVKELSFAVPLEDDEQNDLERVLAVFERAAHKREADGDGAGKASVAAKPRATASRKATSTATTPRKGTTAAKKAATTAVAKSTRTSRAKKTI
ncbi:3-hydroxyalkanoate synthetase [Pandoraea sputorum]|uniref:3-hydroxyalkanoate synthetase n=2 Tax=Pandoraea sputorum TaxID=93222 RepID=A0A5E5BCM7_9BURK|nr:3-hydroxyalkanoate synthetase [Pandoraea sputorum]